MKCINDLEVRFRASVTACSDFEQRYKAAIEEQACISATAAADRAAATEASQLSSAAEAARLSAQLHAASERVAVLEGSLADQRVCSRTLELQIQALESQAAATLRAVDDANTLRGSRPTTGSQTVCPHTTMAGSQTDAQTSNSTSNSQDADVVADNNIRLRARALEAQLSDVSRERDAAVTRFLGLRDEMKQLQVAHQEQLEVCLGPS